MTRSATFILSFDCEGKWGMADAVSDHHRRFFTDRNIRDVYRKLTGLLSALDVPATFAFVGAFTLSAEQYAAFAGRFADCAAAKLWLRQFERDFREGSYEGWFVPGLIDEVQKYGRHEIASHGFTHLLFDEARTSSAEADIELRAAIDAAALHRLTLETFIYPRNAVGHGSLLSKYGFLAYRDGLAQKRRTLDRVMDLASELNTFASAQPHPTPARPLCIPAGRFVNWRNGPRKLIPIDTTVARWKNLIDDAIRNGRLAHAWMHPHNLIDGDRQFELLERILAYVSRCAHNGDLRVLTQVSYAREQLGIPASPESKYAA